jgi:benzoate transport
MSDNRSAAELIRDRINSKGFSTRQLLIVAVCFFLNVADGFDVVSISMAASHIADTWQIEAKVLGVVLSAELAGMMIGSILLATLSDRYGRRTILVGSVSAIALAMLLTAYVNNIPQLLVLRFITGLGIGGVLSSAAATASEFSPEKYRHTAVIVVTSGFAFGALIVGPVAAYFLSTGDWPSLFTTGGVLGVALLLLVLLLVPESLEFVANQRNNDGGQRRLDRINKTLNYIKLEGFASLPGTGNEKAVNSGSIRALLDPELRSLTLRLWLTFFLGSWIIFLLMKWTPKLFVNLGFELNTGIYALTVFTVGGLFGNIFMAVLSTRVRLTTLISAMCFVCASLLAVYSVWQSSNIPVLYTLLFMINFCATGAMTSMYAVAINSYPTQLRATGLGWGIGLGRSGAIASPVAAGFLVDAGWTMWGIYLALAAPAVLLAAFIVRSLKSREPAS